MEDIRTQYVEDSNRETQIKHWEVTLSNATHAVFVAQRTLEGLYRQRYEATSIEIGHTAMQEHINSDLPTELPHAA